MTGHLVPLSGGWSIWRWFCIRSAGFPIARLARMVPDRLVGAIDALVATDAARAAALREVRAAFPQAPDRKLFNRAFEAAGRGRAFEAGAFPAAIGEALERLRHAHADGERAAAELATGYAEAADTVDTRLRELAKTPRFREAIAWQNPGFLGELDQVLVGAAHDAEGRRAARTLLMYAQRYYTKCDTIGFFGPIGWGAIREDAAFSARHGELLARRTVYFEHWAIAELAKTLAATHPEARRWFAPRRNPTRDARLATDQALVDACDGQRTALEIAEVLATDPDEILARLESLREQAQILWTLDAAVGTPFPERDLQMRIERVGDPSLRDAMLAPLAALEDLRVTIDAAAGSADAVADSIAALDDEFVRLTGTAAVRRGGQTYAGRTLVYEDCVRDVKVELGDRWLAVIAPPLSLLAQSARWYTHAVSVRYLELMQTLYRELRVEHGPAIPFPVFMAAYRPHGRSEPSLRAKGGVPRIIEEVVAGLRARWATVLELPDEDVSRVARTVADLRPRIDDQFAAPHSGIPLFRYHSPDLMLAAESADAIARGDFQAVLGEIHTGNNTISPVFLKEHPDRDLLVAARSADLPRTDVYPVFGKDFQTRATFVSFKPHDVMLELGDAVRAWPRDGVIHPSELCVEEHAGEIVVRCTRSDRRFELAAVFAYFLLATSTDHYSIAPERAHVPRVTVDQLVIVRETWRFATGDLAWARAKQPLQRFTELQRFRHQHALPRYVFVKTPTEKKPFFSDLSHPGLVEILARHAGRAESLEITEMLPGPEQCWLADADGQRYVSELRMVLLDAGLGLGD